MFASSTDEAEVRKVLDLYRRHINSGLARLLSFLNLDAIEVGCEGVFVYDSRGRRFIDFVGGYGVFNFGHRHPRIISAVRSQLERMPLSSRLLVNDKQVELAHKLSLITPGNISKFFFANSGAEAVEGALKLARLATGKSKVIYTTNSFHGKTLGALSATGRKGYRSPFEPLLADFVEVPFGDVSAMAEVIDERTCAVILEPIQGEGGINVPAEGYLSSVRELTKENDVLLILDEVQTGFGRTGKIFASEWENVEPDIIVVGKALGGGVMPIGAFGAGAELWLALEDNPLLHTSTFGGNPLACSAGCSAVDVLLEEKLADRALRVGSRFIQNLKAVVSKHPEIVNEVRGRALMIGLDFTSRDTAELFVASMIENGVLVAFTLNNPKVIRLEPPLNTPDEVFDEVLEKISSSLSAVASIAKSSHLGG